jgi:hypothetical protein
VAQRPLWYDPAVQQQPQVQPSYPSGSNLAQALMARQQPLVLPTPSTGISPAGIEQLAKMFKGETDPVKYGMPGKTVDPRTGMGSTPLGYDPYANMTPADLAAQSSSVLPFGEGPSAAYNPTSIPPSMLERWFGGGGSSSASLPAPVSSSPGWFDNGGLLARLFGGG